MDTVTLTDLGPIIAAVLGPVLGFVVLSMRYQHQDSVKTRELISSSEKETRELISSSEKETRELISGSEKETRELISGSEKETRELISGSEKETREWVTTQVEGAFNKLSAELAEHKQDIKENFKEVRGDLKEIREDLSEARERLARVEGHLQAGKAPPSQDSDGQASNAA